MPPAEHIAEFDQDGTLWVEHPVYSQVIYVLDRVGALVKEKPELKDREPFRAVLSGDRDAIAKLTDSPSDDQRMLEYVKAGTGARLSVVVMHDDVKREYAYGPAQGLPETKVGTLSQAMYDEAKKEGWVVISMKNDWKRIIAFE